MNILLIRLRLVGDVVFTTPAIRAIRRRFPDARLTYLVEPAAAPVVRTNPHLDAVIVSPPRRGLARVVEDLSLARRLRRARFDTVVDFHGGPRSSWLCLASGAPVRIGYTITGRGWMYSHQVERTRELLPRHSVVSQWDLLKALDPSFATPPDLTTDSTEMPAEPGPIESVDRRLRSAGVDRDHQIIVVHVSAGNPFRRWPIGAFVETIVQLARADSRRRIVVTAGPSDEVAETRVKDEARAQLGNSSDAVPEVGALDLAEFRALAGRSALYIGGDSGPLHIASTTTVPIVGLYGPTLPVRSEPWRNPSCVTESVELDGLACRPCNQRSCEPGDFRCLTRLESSAVVEAAERALRRADSMRTKGGVAAAS